VTPSKVIKSGIVSSSACENKSGGCQVSDSRWTVRKAKGDTYSSLQSQFDDKIVLPQSLAAQEQQAGSTMKSGDQAFVCGRESRRADDEYPAPPRQAY
jgi:hypothetical protein